MSTGFFLKDILLNCQNTDRQIVKWALQLLSHTTAQLFRNHFEENAAALELADFIDVLAETFKVMTSTQLYHDDKAKTALGMNLDYQLEVLKKCLYFFNNTNFNNPYIKFQKGAILTLNGIIELYFHLKENYGIQYLLTSKCCK